MAQNSHVGHRPQRYRALTSLLLCGLTASCGSSLESPSPATDSVTVSATSFGPGGSVVIPPEYVYNELGGVVLRKDSGVMSVTASLASARDQAFGQLSIYLLSANGNGEYCAQNNPDSPTWRSLPAGWSTTYTVTGFQVFRLPCTVSGLRVMFHTRDNVHLGLPPTAAETLVEVTVPTNFTIRR
jgi:hypothetical protein